MQKVSCGAFTEKKIIKFDIESRMWDFLQGLKYKHVCIRSLFFEKKMPGGAQQRNCQLSQITDNDV